MGKFGWSMPPGAWEATLPYEEGYLIALKCPKCGRFISMRETRVEPWEDSYVNEAGEKVVLGADVTCYYTCSRCGEVTDPIPVFI